EEARGQQVAQVLRPSDRAGFADLFAACLRQPGQHVLISGFYGHHLTNDILLYGQGRLINCLHDPSVRGAVIYFRELAAEVHPAEDWGKEPSLQGTVINALPDQIYVKDRFLRLLTANAAAVQARGQHSVEDVRYKTDLQFFPEQLAARFEEGDLAVLNSG